MALENLMVYALIEAPTLALSFVLRRVFSIPRRRADSWASAILLALVVVLALVAWFRTP